MFIYTDYIKRQYIVEYNFFIILKFFHLNNSAAFISTVLFSLSELLSSQRDSLFENLCLINISESLFYYFNIKLWHRWMSYINVEFLKKLFNVIEEMNIKNKKL